ncbi:MULTISPECIES: ABC transporter permease [unclassified Streptomyces]|uniref:ABC transporter permease n=1 Tax=unclassified Streptomyces TaxID=2593676 RepID=UPI002DDB369D|nr:ABC transporter permease [Streptomyces sp. NBC_01750]WSA98224.1 ABC transporter permease [Streptomyces sp. NBC_01794]WSD37239.1 ABC transporter permease [Streptomyces sp. NBC_01750]
MSITAPQVPQLSRLPKIPRTPLGRARWACADGWTVTLRGLTHWVREPGGLIGTLTFPVMMVLMFTYFFGGAMQVPGGGSYREFLVPGMFVMTMVFGMGETVTAVSADKNRGITSRFRTLPMSPSAVVVGRAVTDMLSSLLALAVLFGVGLLIGWEAHGSAGDTVYAVGLLLLLRFALVWAGIYLGLLMKGPEGITMVQTLEFPVGFLTSAFVAPSTMPGWLGTVAEWNPLSSTVLATRELFGNPGWGGDSWIAQNAQLMAVVWPVVLCAVFFPLSVRRFRNLTS